MRVRRFRCHAQVAIVTALSLSVSPAVPVLTAQTSTRGQAAASPQVDYGWPRAYTTPSGASLVIYQPQVASWDRQAHIVLYTAVSYTPKGAQSPALGTLRLEAETNVSVPERLVDISAFAITESNFSTLNRDQIRAVIAEMTAAVPPPERIIALDRVLAGLDKSQIIPHNVEGVKADPPPIFFSKTPAVLVNIDGEPVWNPIKDNDLRFAVNTNWDLFEHGPTRTFFLRDDAVWLKAADLQGPWSPAGDLPPSFQKLPADENWKEVRASLPGKKIRADKAPKVFVSLRPAELILLEGEPNYVFVPGATNLLWVSNTASDVFRMGRTGPVYFLVAGRWFSAPDFTGPWSFATPNLPADFRKIPLEHPRSRVLASVPGTDQAVEAVLLAGVPQTARVNKKELAAPDVTFQGAPEFQPIEKTTVQRAVNTDKDIIKVGDLYYMCFQGVWFMAKSPTGPWEVTGSVPKQIYEIPISSPAHTVTYVTVQESSPSSDWVVFATAAAFTGLMIAWGCAVWGTGYYYPPYVWYGPRPIYYPFFPTYGYGAIYNPWTGAYARGAVVYGPYGGAGAGARYNPATGTYARGAVAWGPYGAQGVAQAYNPRTGAYGTTRQGANVYGSWGSTAVQRGDQWATTSRVTNNATGTTSRITRTDQGTAISRNTPGGGGFVAKGTGGDIYAGKDGSVYRNQDGTWQKYDNGGWNPVQQPTQQQREQAQAQAKERAGQAGVDSSTVGQLNKDRQARSEGTQRTGIYSGLKSSGGTERAGSYRPSGGARTGARRK